MALKIAAADQNWLQQMVLGERRRLASLHRAALMETERACDDHKGDKGYEAITEGKDVKKAAFDIDAPELTQQDLEIVNAANNFLLDNYPEQDPKALADMVDASFTPGMSITQLMSKLLPNLEHAASTKKADQSPNEPTGYAVESHQGDKAYENDLDPKVGSTKKAEAVPNTLDPKGGNHDPNDPGSKAVSEHQSEMDALARQLQSLTSNPAFNPNDPLKD